MPLTTTEYTEFMQTVHQIRDVYVTMEKEVKKHGEELGETKEQNARLEAIIQRYEADMQKPPTAPSGEQKDEELMHKKMAFFKAMRYGYQHLLPEEKQLVPTVNAVEAPPIPGFETKAFPVGALVSAEDTAGGLFAPPEYVSDIIKGFVTYSPIRNYAKVRTTTNKSVQQPKRTGTITAQWVGEKVERSVLTGYSLGRIEIPTQEMYALVLVSDQDLEDVNFDLENELRSEFSEQFGVAEGKAFVLGNGVLQPQGILTHPDIPLSTGIDLTIQAGADRLIDLLYSLPDIYASNAAWCLRRSTVAWIRKMKYSATVTEYIWQPGLSNLAPNTILGVPYFEAPDMPPKGVTQNCILLGDFTKGYTIVNRVGMAFKRLAERWVEDSLIGIYARMRVGGQVVLPEALRIGQTQS